MGVVDKVISLASPLTNLVSHPLYLVAVCTVLAIVFLMLLASENSGEGFTLAAQVVSALVLSPFIVALVFGGLALVVGTASSPFIGLGLVGLAGKRRATRKWEIRKEKKLAKQKLNAANTLGLTLEQVTSLQQLLVKLNTEEQELLSEEAQEEADNYPPPSFTN